MENRTLAAALAGLLHDIGKFAQRAGEGGTLTWDNQAKAGYGYYHALLTDGFISKYVPEAWKSDVKLMAVNHHRPNQRDEYAVALADRLSAGERADAGDGEDKIQPQQMLSIFCTVKADNTIALQDAFLPLAPLQQKKEVIFPAQRWDERRVKGAYERMWDDFCAQAKSLKQAHDNASGDLMTYIESLSMLLQRYTWCIPSAYYKTRPDISLHDHNRMTAALAGLLVDAPITDTRLQELARAADDAEDELALLVGGDIGGVQEFLYTITARGATSALRGRSFYLQLLTEVVARFVLDQLGLPIVNLIYAGGGNFYLLARRKDEQRLKEIHRDVSRILWQQHHGEVYIALASLPLQAKDFHNGRISAAWERLSLALQKVKQRRFAELGQDIGVIFDTQGHGGNEEQQCQVCGGEHPSIHIEKHDEDKVRKCPACFSYEQLGDDLRRANYLLLEQITPAKLEENATPGGYAETLAGFGWKAVLLEDLKTQPANPQNNRRILYALSDEALSKALQSTSAFTAAGRKLLVNVTPVFTQQVLEEMRKRKVKELPVEGSITPFHVLEQLADGIPRLGVLRMDMDNLGKLFENGLGEKATLSRVAGLSFAVSLYFEGWVETLAKDLNRQDCAGRLLGDRLYSIYSGGDDLLFVGAWDAVVELARRIRADLTHYAANHPDIHASGGIVLCAGKYPLAQAALDAGGAEEQAKDLRRHKNGREAAKDALCFLGQAIGWEKFGLQDCAQQNIDSAHALMHLLVDGIDEKVAMPLVRRLIGFYERYREAEEKRRQKGDDQTRSGAPQTLWGPWMWLASYHLARLAKQNEKQFPEGARSIRSLNEQLKQDQFRSIEWSGMAARWTELRLRK